MDPLSPNSPVQEEMCIKDSKRRKQNHEDPLMIHNWVLNRAGANTVLAGSQILQEARNMKVKPIFYFSTLFKLKFLSLSR